MGYFYYFLQQCTRLVFSRPLLKKIVQRTSQFSIGVFLDNALNVSALKELFIDFFNGASRETILGAKKKKNRSGLMITSNNTVSGNAR